MTFAALFLLCHLAPPDVGSRPAAHANAGPAVGFIGGASIPGTALDRSLLRDEILPGVPHARLGGFGSAIDYDPSTRTYFACDDRGPADGAAFFRDRLQAFTMTIAPGASEPVVVELRETTLLNGSPGLRNTGWFVGAAAAPDMPTTGSVVRYDPEGLRCSGRGTFFISDEYGPFIDEFDKSGTHLRRLGVPAKFLVTPLGGGKKGAGRDAAGRQDNRGFEGLAASTDGQTLTAILQSPLIQDGALDEAGVRAGRFVRMLEIAPGTGATREFVYPLTDPAFGVSEILAVGGTTFLVLERDGKPGESAVHKAVYLIDTAGATDVSLLPALPAIDLPPFVKPASKRLLIDFLNPAFGLAGSSMPEKIEGLTFGPDLDRETRSLVVTSDNDFIAEQPSRFWVFSVPRVLLNEAGPSSQPTAQGDRQAEGLVKPVE